MSKQLQACQVYTIRELIALNWRGVKENDEKILKLKLNGAGPD